MPLTPEFIDAICNADGAALIAAVLNDADLCSTACENSWEIQHKGEWVLKIDRTTDRDFDVVFNDDLRTGLNDSDPMGKTIISKETDLPGATLNVERAQEWAALLPRMKRSAELAVS